MINGPECLTAYPSLAFRWKECGAADHASWLAEIQGWRAERRVRVGLDASRYDDPRLKWTQSAFMQPQVMVEDRYLYDPATGRYTVDRLLDDFKKRYGGIDAVLIWPTYPNMGIDARNQIDMLLSMPGGIEGVRGMVADFHRQGVHVLFPFMLWDHGTHDPGAPWPQAITRVMADVGADGMNGDTQDGVPLTFSTAAEQIGHPLAFQPELSFADEALSWNVMSWGQYTFDPVPKVDRYRWLEPRHMVNISDRWARSKTDDLQFAFFNGGGWESWENVWGIWNGISPRDGEATRRVATIERGVAPFLTSPDWEPFYPTHHVGVYASRWPKDGQMVWTLVNRDEYDVDGEQLTVPAEPGMRWFDLYHGRELIPVVEGDKAILSFPIEAQGYGAVLAVHGQPDAAVDALLTTMKIMSAEPLAKFDGEWKPLAQSMTPIAATKPYAQAPAGMVEIPAGRFHFTVAGTEIEGSDQIGVDVAYPWEAAPGRFHERYMDIKRFFIDRTPVTDSQFKAFLDATRYRPQDDANFLKDWTNGSYPQGWADRPVTWVSIEDARAYAAWAGKRLPNEWEWQYAAQGADLRLYPWGDAWRADAVPEPNKGRDLLPPAPVGGHPQGASPFGVQDLVGGVWQWTNEFEDEHTRAAILRGGSSYQPQGAIWYFPQAYRNDQHSKLLLMSPGRDRSGSIGFRCVADAE
ncbi:MAG TPA: SUMF1/EgtB/PvdO family nonheme iron enzyme [Stellaceae bacterium]|nr:SUMF1/EgtB/PvdO family nonheme iron enzyme [Stellaceae bacterium]